MDRDKIQKDLDMIDWATPPPLLPGPPKFEQKWPTLNQKLKRKYGRNRAPCPNLSPVGGDATFQPTQCAWCLCDK